MIFFEHLPYALLLLSKSKLVAGQQDDLSPQIPLASQDQTADSDCHNVVSTNPPNQISHNCIHKAPVSRSRRIPRRRSILRPLVLPPRFQTNLLHILPKRADPRMYRDANISTTSRAGDINHQPALMYFCCQIRRSFISAWRVECTGWSDD